MATEEAVRDLNDAERVARVLRHVAEKMHGANVAGDEDLRSLIDGWAAGLLGAAERLDVAGAQADNLQRWKDEALPVIAGLQKLGRALDLPLGTSITGEAAADAAARLKAERDTARDDERQAWSAWLDSWVSAVGPEPPTVDAIARALREGARPFGVARGEA